MVSDVVIKGIGYWLLTIFEAIIVFVGVYIGNQLNGFSAEFVALIAIILSASAVLGAILIKYFFKLEE